MHFKKSFTARTWSDQGLLFSPLSVLLSVSLNRKIAFEVDNLAPGTQLTFRVLNVDEEKAPDLKVNHTFNDGEIDWLKLARR